MYAVVGSAGRKDDGPRMSKALFEAAYQKWLEIVKEHNIRSGTSGASAWMDHILIKWALEAQRVERKVGENKVAIVTIPDVVSLHLPCPMKVGKDGHAYFTPEVDKRWYCKAWEARTINYYHEEFSKKVYGDRWKSRDQILELIGMGLEPLPMITVHVKSGDGLLGRNVRVADDATEGLVAFTFSAGMPYPKDGGTADTWRQHFNLHPEAIRIHVDLGGLL